MIAALATLSMSSAFSQSYLVLNNGVTLTTDRAGFVYDFGQFVLPYKVTVNGGQFLVENSKLSTIDGNGFMYDKDEEVNRIKGKGLNYIVNDKSDLITIDGEGFFYKYKDDAEVKKASKFGGNFFLTEATVRRAKVMDLYTINAKGNYFKMTIPGLNPAEISLIGGTYFIARGVAHTVSRDGFVFPKPDLAVGTIIKTGGNFFINSANNIFTVSETGVLSNPVIPLTLKVNTISKVGANYMIDAEGRIFTVDKDGNLSERAMPDHDLKSTKILSL